MNEARADVFYVLARESERLPARPKMFRSLLRLPRVLVLSTAVLLACVIIAFLAPVRLSLDFGVHLHDRYDQATKRARSDVPRTIAFSSNDEPSVRNESAAHLGADLITIIINNGTPVRLDDEPASLNFNEKKMR